MLLDYIFVKMPKIPSPSNSDRESNGRLLVKLASSRYNSAINEGGASMNSKDILFELRTKNGLSQDELAEKVFVTRQAVSR